MVLYHSMTISYAELDVTKMRPLVLIHTSVDKAVGLRVGLLHGSDTNACSDCISKQQCGHIWEAENVL